MFKGALIAESLRTGAKLEGIPLVIRDIYRVAPPNVAPEQPAIWTIIGFEVADEQAEPLAKTLKDILDSPGWYCDYRSPGEHIVVFPGRFFRYRLDDRAARAQVQAHGRSAGVPEAQLDWRD
jgi:hypothetical protein